MEATQRQQVYDYLLTNGLVDASVFELTDEDAARGIQSVEEKVELAAPAEDHGAYITFEVDKQQLVVFLSAEGVQDYVADQLAHLDEDEVVKLLGQFTNGFADLLDYWGIKFVSEGDTAMAIAPKTDYIKSRTSSLRRQAGGTGLGAYRRGKVLTDIGDVQPGQLLAHESILFKAINLVKCTQVFQDKFYGIFVSPENPNEKSKAADEEFVVYPTDLEKGEYYIALEPAPADVGATSGDASGEGTKPVAPAAVDAKPEGTEKPEAPEEVPAEEPVPAGKGASKTAAYTDLINSPEELDAALEKLASEGVLQFTGFLMADGQYVSEDTIKSERAAIDAAFEEFPEWDADASTHGQWRVVGFDVNEEDTEMTDAHTDKKIPTLLGIEASKQAIKSPVRQNLDYGTKLEQLAAKLKLADVEKVAAGESDAEGVAALEGARVYDKGSEVGVRLMDRDIRDWATRWPGLRWPTSGYFASFSKSNGDLLELETGNHGNTERWDDDGLAALLADAYVYAMQKLEKKNKKTPATPAPTGVTAGQDEPASAKEAPAANPTTYGQPTHETPLGHFMDSKPQTTDADRVIDEVLTYIEAAHPTDLHVEYKDGTYVVLSKDFKPLAEIWTAGDVVQVTALVGDKGQTVGEKASDIVDLVLSLKDHKDPTPEDNSVEDFEAAAALRDEIKKFE